jgi:hypothetical protein
LTLKYLTVKVDLSLITLAKARQREVEESRLGREIKAPYVWVLPRVPEGDVKMSINTPVILATQEAEIRRIAVQNQPRKIVHKTLF